MWADDAVPEEGRDAKPSPIHELVGEHEVHRLVFQFEGADRAGRQDSSDAQLLEAVNVRPVVDLARHQAMSATVARKKSDPLSLQQPVMYASLGFPNGVSSSTSFRCLNPGMSYNPIRR